VGDALCRARFDQSPDVERVSELTHDCAEPQPRLARSAATADPGVEDHEPLEPVLVLDGDAQSDGAAPVVDDERRPAEVELLDEPRDGCDVAVVRVPADLCGLVRTSEPDQGGRDDA